MKRIIALPAFFLVLAAAACSGSGIVPATAPAPVTQSQTGERAPADAYGGIPDIVHLCVSPSPSPSPSPTPKTKIGGALFSQPADAYGGIPDVIGVVFGSLTKGCL